MATAQIHLLPAARNTVMVVDDQSTSRAILEQVVRSLDERVVVEGFARPVDAVVWAARHVADLVLVDPHESFVVRAADSPSQQGYTPFEGLELTGRVTATYLRGQRIYADGKVLGAPRGQYLHRPTA